MRLARVGALTVAAAFTVSGITHLVKPAVFKSLMPKAIPYPKQVVYVSGVAELVAAYGLVRRTWWGGPKSAVLLIAVWPGNLTQAIRLTDQYGLKSWQAASGWSRVPLQLPLIVAVLADHRNAKAAGELTTF